MIRDYDDQRDVDAARYRYLVGYLSAAQHRVHDTPEQVWTEAHAAAQRSFPDAPKPLSAHEQSSARELLDSIEGG